MCWEFENKGHLQFTLYKFSGTIHYILENTFIRVYWISAREFLFSTEDI